MIRVGVCVVEICGLLARALFSLGNGILCYTGDVIGMPEIVELQATQSQRRVVM